jgi:hypothetical protein
MITGVAWYTSSDWSRVKATAVDPERFEATFEEWVAMANEALAKLKNSGVVAQKYLIDADDFLGWCKEKGIENDAAARARFVSERLRSGRHPGGA